VLKIFNHQSNTVTGAAIILSGASLISRLVGMLRDRVLAHNFGAGDVMDAYYAAFKVPDLIYNLLIVGALTAGFIPTFTKLLNDKEKNSAAWRLSNNVLNILGAALVILCSAGILFTPQLSRVIAPGFDGENLARVVSFTRVMFLSPLLLGLSMIMGGILQSLKRFVLYSLTPIFYNLGIIFGATFLYGRIGEIGLAVGVVIGAFLHFSIQAYGAISSGWKYKWVFELKDKDTTQIWKLMVPRTLGLAITQFNQIIITMLASLLPAGSIAVYNYANNLHAVPIGIVAIPFAIAVFPVLSASAAQNDIEKFIESAISTIRQIIFLIIPATIIMLLLRAQIVRVILGSGEFNWSDTINTANALAFFSLGLVFQSIVHVLVRAFYALSNTKTPFIIGVVSEIVVVGLAFVLMKRLGVPGLAIGVSAGSALQMFLLFIMLRANTKTLKEKELFGMASKVLIASFLMAIVIQLLKYPLAQIFDQRYFWGIFGHGFFAGIGGIAVYLLLCYILKVPEFAYFKQSFTKKFLRVRNINNVEIIEQP
jgi:putative peptidoglycan lipid II flippase